MTIKDSTDIGASRSIFVCVVLVNKIKNQSNIVSFTYSLESYTSCVKSRR